MTPNLETHLGPLRHFTLIDTIAREGTLLGAAQSVGLTQSAVTKSLQEIEATFGLTAVRTAPIAGSAPRQARCWWPMPGWC